VAITFSHFSFVSSDSNCCCCDVTNYYDVNRTWVEEANCTSPLRCCKIPTKEECELKLNPTYDGSCGHNSEKKNQIKHNGVLPQKVPRPGDSFLQGWFGQRLMDENGNVIEEWCIDNYDYDSFFLWRFVSCNGDYPHWFGRCAFPSATNVLIYKPCDSDDFERTVPSCFGEVQEMNIGLGKDYGHDIDYRYDVQNETLAIWCTNYSNPKDPPANSINPAPGEDDGIVPFYLDKCRRYNEMIAPVPYKPATISDAERSKFIDPYTPENNMYPLTFRINFNMIKLKDNFYEIIIDSNHMPLGYEAILHNGDNWSISFPSNIIIENIFFNNNIKDDWKFNISKDNYATFTYINNETYHLINNIQLNGFIIEINNVYDEIRNEYAGWIARSNHSEGNFVGFGKFDL
jgi:hypothetical protein